MKSHFPILNQNIVYLDSAATSQKPQAVLNRLQKYYTQENANVHRGIHKLAEKATEAYEDARATLADFINAPKEQVIFTKGTTEGINFLAQTIPILKDDIIVLTELDHHSNIVPWQARAKKVGAIIKWLPAKNGELDFDKSAEILKEAPVKILALNHISNVTGSEQEINHLASFVHAENGIVIVDGAQATPHIEIDITTLQVDAYAFSGHKMYGPTGIGVLYLSEKLANELPPYQFGGEMIHEVRKEGSTYANSPHKFEAGTPPIAQAAALAEAAQFIESNRKHIKNESEVVQYALQQLKKIPEITIISHKKSPCLVTFTLQDIHPHDVAQFLDSKNIAIRAGHHCTQIFHDTQNITASCRASFGIYNDKEDVNKLVEALKGCVEAFNV